MRDKDEKNVILWSESPQNNDSTFQQKLYRFYVGIDIGYKFHVASCIPFEDLANPKGVWKRRKTLKFNSDSQGINTFLTELQRISDMFSIEPSDFFILLEPTGGHYGYLVMRVLMDKGYTLYQVENKAVKDFRERNLGIKEKSDDIDARVMAYMGFHKTLHPVMTAVRLVTPFTPTQVLFRTLTRDRWLLSQQLTRRKNQVQQLFAVTNPELKSVFKRPGSSSALKLALEYPTASDMAKATEEELGQALIKAGSRTHGKKKAAQLSELLKDSISIPVPQLIHRQTWLIKEALRIQEAIDEIDKQVELLLHGSDEEGIPPHPYTPILFSFPVMSPIWACVLIGVIGDVNRFENEKKFKKYLGVSAESAQSGTSVNTSHMTFDGVRDTRRIFYQMALILLSPKIKGNVFRMHYERLITGRDNKPPMKKKTAIGHVCGKISQALYSCLKNNKLYDADLHAKSMGLSLKND